LKKTHSHHDSLVAAIKEYKQSLGQFSQFQLALAKRQAQLREPEALARYQLYLDLKETPIRTMPGGLALRVEMPAELLEWGDALRTELQAAHSTTERLRQQVYDTLTDALYCLGAACIDWIAPREDLSRAEGLIKPAFAAASAYRRAHIDGIEVLATDGPFISGLAKRLGIPPSSIYREPAVQVSAFEQAYWAVTHNNSHTPGLSN
jgi:hypothetical protein